MGLKKKLVLLSKDVYFSIPCIKNSRACGYKYYKEILGIYISPADEGIPFPKWRKPWMNSIENWIADILLEFMKKNKKILREDYDKNIEQE